jgi:hypothetical protein
MLSLRVQQRRRSVTASGAPCSDRAGRNPDRLVSAHLHLHAGGTLVAGPPLPGPGPGLGMSGEGPFEESFGPSWLVRFSSLVRAQRAAGTAEQCLPAAAALVPGRHGTRACPQPVCDNVLQRAVLYQQTDGYHTKLGRSWLIADEGDN